MLRVVDTDFITVQVLFFFFWCVSAKHDTAKPQNYDSAVLKDFGLFLVYLLLNLQLLNVHILDKNHNLKYFKYLIKINY